MRYGTIVADPPWDYGADGKRWPSRSIYPGHWIGPVRHATMPYPVLTLDEIGALPVPDLADGDCRLFLWTTNRHLPAAFGVAESWGFTYRQLLVWQKLGANFGGSVAPTSAEFLMVAVKGHPAVSGRMPTAVLTTASPKKHSRKPEAFLDYIEQVSPGPYVELFARRNRLGWDTWGDEALEHVSMTRKTPPCDGACSEEPTAHDAMREGHDLGRSLAR